MLPGRSCEASGFSRGPLLLLLMQPSTHCVHAQSFKSAAVQCWPAKQVQLAPVASVSIACYIIPQVGWPFSRVKPSLNSISQQP